MVLSTFDERIVREWLDCEFNLTFLQDHNSMVLETNYDAILSGVNIYLSLSYC